MHYECIPDWRWQAIKKAQREQTPLIDDFMRDVYSVMLGTTADEIIEAALTLHSVPYKRDTLIAFFLSRATHQQIKTGTWIEFDVLEIFEKLFIDPDAFGDKMDLRLYATFYRDTVCSEGMEPFIDKAIAEGPYALLQYMATGNEVVRVPDDEVATRLVMTAYAKLAVAGQEPILGLAAKEAREWGKQAIQALTVRNRLHAIPADTEDILLGIKEREVTTAIGEGGVGFDVSRILH